jgi:5-methylcytosine-specific restriction endonuclease McrA
MQTKYCPKCKQDKPFDEFGKAKDRPSGRQSYCKECSRANNKHWYAEDVEGNRAKRQAHYNANQAELNKKHKEWNKANPEKCRASSQRWAANNPLKRLFFHRSYMANNPGKNQQYLAVRRAHKLKSEGHYTAAEWEALKKKYNYTCLKCHKREPEILLTPDHVKPLAKGGSNSIDNIQPLCFGCNRHKHTRTVDYRPQT